MVALVESGGWCNRGLQEVLCSKESEEGDLTARCGAVLLRYIALAKPLLIEKLAMRVNVFVSGYVGGQGY